jgi:membrane protein insertase Oxa1/YidC/SpoIIIJ
MSSIHLSPAYLHPVTAASTALEFLSTTLHPIGGAVAAIVVLTLLVRLALHPLVRAAVRGERARAALAPRVAELRRTHAGNVTARFADLGGTGTLGLPSVLVNEASQSTHKIVPFS